MTGRPYLSSFGNLNIQVIRNALSPTFIPASYSDTINEDFQTGEDIRIVSLVDPDGGVSIGFYFQ